MTSCSQLLLPIWQLDDFLVVSPIQKLLTIRFATRPG